MRFSTLVTLCGLFAAVSAQLPNMPPCTLACLYSPTVDYDDCISTDVTCLCRSQTFLSTSKACIERTCIGDQLTAAVAYAKATCASVGVTLSSSPTATSSGFAPTSNPTGSSSGSSSGSSAGNSSSSATKKSGPPIGAIVGAAVGGVAVIAIAGVALFLGLRRRKTNNGGYNGNGEKYSTVPSNSGTTIPSDPYAQPSLNNNPFNSTSTTNNAYATNNAYTPAPSTYNSYTPPPTNNVYIPPPQIQDDNPYTPSTPLTDTHTITSLSSNPYLPTSGPNVSHTFSPSQPSMPRPSITSPQRVDTPSTTYFETSSTIQGRNQPGADMTTNIATTSTTDAPPVDAHAPPSFAASSSDSPVMVSTNDGQAPLTGEQLDFVTSLQNANVPHAEIVAVMERMRGKAAGGEMAAPPMYDFKEKVGPA